MTHPVQDLPAVLRGAVDDIAAEFGGPARVLTDERQGTDVDPPTSTFVWTYQVSIPMTAGARETLTESVVPQMVARGWRATSRDTDRAFGVHFGRDGFDVGVLIGRSDGADVVVGGSSPEFATVP